MMNMCSFDAGFVDVLGRNHVRRSWARARRRRGGVDEVHVAARGGFRDSATLFERRVEALDVAVGAEHHVLHRERAGRRVAAAARAPEGERDAERVRLASGHPLAGITTERQGARLDRVRRCDGR
jgi:hypothetical protein